MNLFNPLIHFLVLFAVCLGCGGDQQPDTKASDEKMAGIQSRLDAANEMIRKLTADNNHLRSQVSAKNRDLQASDAQYEALRAKITSLETALADEKSRRREPQATQQQRTKAASLPDNAVSRDDFTGWIISHDIRFSNKRPQDIQRKYGKPDATWKTGESTYWRYLRRTFDPVTGKLDSEAVIEFTDPVGNGLGAANIEFR
jgi:hypothetical protein